MLKPLLLSPLALALLPVLAAAHDADASLPSANRQVVVRDAETGQLRAPTAAELEALDAKANRMAAARANAAPAPLQQKAHATGARGARLTDAFMSYAVVTRAADGSLVQQCLEGSDKLPEALKTRATTAPTAAKE